jgi:hypothetical protein
MCILDMIFNTHKGERVLIVAKSPLVEAFGGQPPVVIHFQLRIGRFFHLGKIHPLLT